MHARVLMRPAEGEELGSGFPWAKDGAAGEGQDRAGAGGGGPLLPASCIAVGS